MKNNRFFLCIVVLLTILLCLCSGCSDKKKAETDTAPGSGLQGEAGKDSDTENGEAEKGSETEKEEAGKGSETEKEEAGKDSDTENGDAESRFEKAKRTSTPDISQIRSICELATLECYYHNVAKSLKEKGTGLAHIGEKERVFWIEYSGVARFGINVSRVMMEAKENEIIITIPKAELLGLSDHTFAEGSYISSDDGFNKNPITSKNQTEAVAAAEEDIRKMFAGDDAILSKAQDNAKKLIENYIRQLGQLSEVEYEITWKYEENLSEASSE